MNSTADHASCEVPNIELGLRFIEDTPADIRGPAVPALMRLGLTAKEACEVLRLHHLRLARAS